jgi:hypothetical protein
VLDFCKFFFQLLLFTSNFFTTLLLSIRNLLYDMSTYFHITAFYIDVSKISDSSGEIYHELNVGEETKLLREWQLK